MSDIKEQLAVLRRRVARIDKKFDEQYRSAVTAPADDLDLAGTEKNAPGQHPPPAQAPRWDNLRPARYFIEEWMSGQVVETPHGEHFETERIYERHRRHGSMDVSSLEEMPDDLLGSISSGEISPSPPARWAFLDTETTGLAGGSGTYAFLVGVGRITPEGFRVRQFFMRDHGEEASLLYALTEHLNEFDVLVTYNGKTYDQPLLETRFLMARARTPFARLEHLDLLFGARRLWKLRFESCRLVDLEYQILGVERQGDLPGEMIPYVYFEYLRTREAFRVAPIFHHNAMDILTLACLTAIVPYAFRSAEETPLAAGKSGSQPPGADTAGEGGDAVDTGLAPRMAAHGAEMVGLARWLRKAERFEQALQLFRRAVDCELSDELLFRTLWDIAMLEKKLKRESEALSVLADLSTCRNPYRVQALEELAKHHEHRERNYAMALELTRTAIGLSDTPALRHREARLERRLASPRNKRLL